MVRLIVAWLVAALIPDMPHPILALFGEQGTGKTSVMRLLSLLIDPSPAPTRTAPRHLGQWAVTASASWVVALDNISTVSDWLSDALCRAVTGDGLTSRALYSDADVSVLTFRRVLAMTSIDAGALRGDLGERLLPADLDVIAPNKRRPDAEIAASFTAATANLLGGLLDLLADVLDQLPKVKTTQLPRMADFARLLHAVDAVKKWTTVADYADTAADVAETVIESDPVAVAIRDLVPLPGSTWTGTAEGLLEKITPERPPKGWPRSPRAAAGALKRITPALRAVGVTVEHEREAGGSRTRLITLTRCANDADPDPASQPSQPSRQDADQQEQRDGSRPVPTEPRAVDAQPSQPSQPSRQPSHLGTASDQREHTSWDGRDGCGGRAHADSPTSASRCTLCGLTTPGPRDDAGRCEQCTPTTTAARA